MEGKFYKLLTVLILIFNLCSYSQTDIVSYKNQYPDESMVILKKIENVTLKINDCNLDIEIDHYRKKLSLSNINQNYSDEYIGFTSFSDITDIKAYYYEPKDTKYSKTQINNIVTSSRSDNSIFYDDYQTKRIVFPNLYKGCISEISYKKEIKDPHLLGYFRFTGFFPVEYAEYSITYPNEVNLSYKIYNDNENIVTFTEEKNRKTTTIKFSVSNYKPGFSLNNDFDMDYYIPHVIVYINDYKACDKYIDVIPDLKGLHNWYYNLTEDINKYSPKIKALSDSIIKGIDIPVDKMKAIFYWVQDNIKYVAFEDGYGGFIPRDADKVVLRKYGDCKDMANLTTQLLKASGIKAYLSWVGTRSIPYSYYEIPTTFNDNHMICTAEINDRYYILDATTYTAFNYPSKFILSKEILVSKNKDIFEVIKVAEVDYNKSVIYDSLFLKIDNSTLIGSGAVNLSGYHAFDLSSQANYSNKENEHKKIENHVIKGSDKFQLDDYKLKKFDNREENNIIEYSFHIPDYIKKFENNIYINLNLSTPYSKRNVDLTQKLYALLIGNHSRIIVKNSLQIPENYTVSYLPEPINFEHGQFGFIINYSIQNNTINYYFDLYLKTLKVEDKDFNNWNQFIKTLNIAYKKSIELTKTINN